MIQVSRNKIYKNKTRYFGLRRFFKVWSQHIEVSSLAMSILNVCQDFSLHTDFFKLEMRELKEREKSERELREKKKRKKR